MAWIRLSDDYNDHPKFDNLSDGAFRLWHQAIGFCRKYQTDGLLPIATVRKFKSFGPKRMIELLTPWQAGENALWLEITGFGIKVHDYLQWNPSKEEENERRTESKSRMQQYRERRTKPGVAPSASPVTSSVTRNEQQTRAVTNAFVPGREGKDLRSLEKEREEKPDSDEVMFERAGRLRQELYPEWYRLHRHGARISIMANTVEFNDALTLVRTWDDARLEKLAKILLTTDDPWISRTDRGFKIFALKASWADDRLRAWEVEHGVAV